MLQIDEKDLVTRFRQPGGADWVCFVNNLLWAACWQMRIPESAVRTCLRTEIPDGGVDTRVEQSSNADLTGYLSEPTIWQYKAADENSLTEASIEGELKKPYASKRIKSGDAYRLCVCAHITDNKRTEIEQHLKTTVKGIAENAATPKLLSAADIARLAGHFPPFVHEFRGFDLQKGTYTLDAWGMNATARTHNFVPNDAFLNYRTLILQHVDEGKIPHDAVLPIVGSAGIGKTRCLYEALTHIKAAPGLVLYIDNEKEALGIATMLASTPRAAAILVVDDCSLDTRYALTQALVGHRARIRAITVHHELQTTRQAGPEILIEKYEQDEIERILQANYPGLAPERLRAYIDVSERYLRLAIDLCEHDSEIVGARALSPADFTIASYYRKRAGDSTEIISALALFTRVGRDGEVSEELDALCHWFCFDRYKVEQRLSQLKDSPGFVERSAIYYRISPEVIAMQAFDEAWKNWADGRSDSFLQAIQWLPEAMQKSFLTRVSRSARPEVREIVRDFFRSYARKFDAGHLGSLDEVLRLKTLIEVDPEYYFPFLKAAVLSATDQELTTRPGGSFGWEPRRELVHIADQLAQFRSHFADAEDVLFRLAKAENEPEIGNNATKTWQRLFRPILSGTPIPFVNRLRLLESRLPSPNEPLLELHRGALGALTNLTGPRFLGSSLFAGHIPEPEWKFSNRDEVIEYVQTTLKALLQFAATRQKRQDADVAYSTTVNAIITFVSQGYLDEVIESTSPSRMPENVRADLYSRFQFLLGLANRYRPHGFFASDDYRHKVLAWLEPFRPEDLLGRLIVEVKGSHWDHVGNEEPWRNRLRALGQEFLSLFEHQTPDADEILRWLHSEHAKGAFDFGLELGRLDAVSALADTACQRAISSNRPDFARGLFAGYCTTHADLNPFLNQKIDEIERTHPETAFYLAQSMGDSAAVFERTLRMIREDRLSPLFLRNLTVWVGTRRTRIDEAKAAIKVLWPLLERGATDAADTAVELIAYQYEYSEDPNGPKLDSSFHHLAWKVVENTMAKERGQGFWWGEIVKKALSAVGADAGADLLARAIVGSNVDVHEISEELIKQLAGEHPESVMNAIGRVMLDERAGWHFRVGRFNIFESLPSNTVSRWLDKVGSEGAAQIARHLPAPSLTAQGEPKLHPLTELVLTRFGDDERVFGQFCAGVHSWQPYWGDFAAAKEEEAKMAEKFLTHPLPAIRKWADVEIESAFREAAMFRAEQDKRRE